MFNFYNFRFFPIQQTIEVASSPVSGIIFSQLRATVTGTVKCLADSGSNCNDISITLQSLDSNGNRNGKQSLALLKRNSSLNTLMYLLNYTKRFQMENILSRTFYRVHTK